MRRLFERRAPGSPDVDAGEKEQPNHVDEMPIPGGELKPDVVSGREGPPIRAQETYKEENHADDDMRAVKAGRHEERRAVDRVLKAERRVDVLVGLGEHEQHAKGDANSQKELE